MKFDLSTYVKRQTKASGVPEKVTDKRVLRQMAKLLKLA